MISLSDLDLDPYYMDLVQRVPSADPTIKTAIVRSTKVSVPRKHSHPRSILGNLDIETVVYGIPLSRFYGRLRNLQVGGVLTATRVSSYRMKYVHKNIRSSFPLRNLLLTSNVNSFENKRQQPNLIMSTQVNSNEIIAHI
jgi:hypothetical protein